MTTTLPRTWSGSAARAGPQRWGRTGISTPRQNSSSKFCPRVAPMSGATAKPNSNFTRAAASWNTGSLIGVPGKSKSTGVRISPCIWWPRCILRIGSHRHCYPVSHARLPHYFEERGCMAGKYFEEFVVGQVFKHQPGRTITEMDNVLFTTLTMNPQPLHLDEEFAKQTEFGQRLVNSLLTLGIAVGLSVADTTLGTTIANLGFDKIEFPKPVFHGDTIYVETEIVDKRESRSRPDAGVVFFEHRAI